MERLQLQREQLTQTSLVTDNGSPQQEVLTVLEREFSLDLSRSKEVDKSSTQYVRNLGHIFLDWIGTRGLVTKKERDAVNDVIDTYVVLDHEEHKTFGLTMKQERMRVFEEQRAGFEAERGTHAFEQRVAYEKHLIQEWEQDFPPANIIRFPVFLVTFSDWHDGNPYSRWPLDASVGEETLHLASNIQNLPLTTATIAQLHVAEELAVKYYVAAALTDCGFDPSILQQYSSGTVSGSIEVWRNFIQKRGEQVAGNLFFNGKANAYEWKILVQEIQSGLARGIIH